MITDSKPPRLYLGKTSFDDENNNIIYCNMKSQIMEANYHDMNLWKVSIPENEESWLEGVNKNNIENNLGGKKLRPNHMLASYFPITNPAMMNIDIIIQVPATTGKCLPMFYLLKL